MNISEDIKEHYFKYFDLLTPDKQFHFATRLKAWSNDPRTDVILAERLKDFSVDNPLPSLQELCLNPPVAKINAAERRSKYFEKYPNLRGAMLGLFRVRHLLYVYDVDVRDLLLTIYSKEELYALSDQIKLDDDALKILSTYAINFIYLVDVILYPRKIDTSFLEHILNLKESYDISQSEDIQLLIYLFTHCIIGDSNFYHSSINLIRKPIYHAMLQTLETIIENNFEAVNLDNKFEFLVCCRILNIQTNLNIRIYAEAEKSLSPEGTYVIDTLNVAKQGNKTSLSDSEHRNVLYIMSTSSYAHVNIDEI